MLLFRWRWDCRTDVFVLGMYLVPANAIRFVIEFVRVNEPVLGPFTLAHLARLAVVAAVFTLNMRTAHARSALGADRGSGSGEEGCRDRRPATSCRPVVMIDGAVSEVLVRLPEQLASSRISCHERQYGY